ncbi:hypothetical protein GCM10009555_017640 [Acrocarpospora macrocephala]|uniref:Uncharacterized protein n=1 Tax=Acrocarpospora macrocephala TaxID=150177 RepID=A0A5M3WEM3_9ACTN|nr:hypothetical protein [Acrocarpospora macrocephala]GES07424.1 hypothetical protein Amac_010190 [Acrocarpospora macrocephala]
MDRNPGIGDIVHYVSHGTPPRADGTQSYPPACRAAIVTAVLDPAGQAGGGIVSLMAVNPEGLFFLRECSHVFAEHQVGGSWHWPEGVFLGEVEQSDVRPLRLDMGSVFEIDGEQFQIRRRSVATLPNPEGRYAKHLDVHLELVQIPEAT